MLAFNLEGAGPKLAIIWHHRRAVGHSIAKPI